MSVLEVRDLTIALPAGSERKQAVSKVSFSVDRGEIVCLVGESGSGKSVIAQGIMGLLPNTLPITGGEVLLEGEDTARASAERQRELRAARMSMIFQEPMTALNPVMSCGEQIDEVLVEHTKLSAQARRAKILDIVREVRLPDPERMTASYPHQLSGGQRQRIVIAMALVLDPVLVIADEPTTALDVTTQAQILNLLRDLQRRHGTAIVFITHDLGVIAQIAHSVVVMYLGRVMEHGPVDDIFHAPKHPYTRSLLRSIPSLLATPQSPLPTIAGSIPHPLGRPAGCAFHPRCPDVIGDLCTRHTPALRVIEGAQSASCFLYHRDEADA
jgi:peptide/nickel transport system ATP-binding protein